MSARTSPQSIRRTGRGLLLWLPAALLLVFSLPGCAATPSDVASPPRDEAAPRVSRSPSTTAGAEASAGEPTSRASAKAGAKAGAEPAAQSSARPPKPATAAKRVTIIFVDVGQGDAVLLQSGSTEVLIDGGPSAGAAAVGAAMRRAGMTGLDYVVASHMHADHIGGMGALVRDHRPSKAFIAGACDTHLRAAFEAARTRITQVRRGASLRFGAVRAKVLSPASLSGDKNADSVVLLLEANGRRILLTGDLTGPNEAAVGSITARGPPLDVLKVAHHGSAYSTDSRFLAQARPRFAVIEVGRNSYGHPSPATVARLRQAGARIYTTQRNGTVTLTIRPDGRTAWRFTKSSRPLLTVRHKAAPGGGAGVVVKANGASTGGGSGAVFITRTGECYHRAGCRYLSHSRIRISLAGAKARGYRPCKVCRPPG